MSALVPISAPETLSEGQKEALLKLLGDEDSTIYQTVRTKIVSFGPEAATWLRPHTLSDDPALRRRAKEIVSHFALQAADNQFLGFCIKHGKDFDLETGAWMLARTRYPNINVEGYQAILDGYARELRERLLVASEPKESLALINDFLFLELGFTGNEKDYYDPENSYLNRVIDRRTGNPINLCLLYMSLARRLCLPVTGIGLPGHFICRNQTSSSEIFVDVFNGGKFMTKADCVQYLVQGNYSLRDDSLAPVSPRRMLLRICGNLHQVYLQLERTEETTRLQRYLVALGR